MNLSVTCCTLFQACNRDQDKLANCRASYQDQPGHYMSCLIDLKMEVVLKPQCQDFLTQVA